MAPDVEYFHISINYILETEISDQEKLIGRLINYLRYVFVYILLYLRVGEGTYINEEMKIQNLYSITRVFTSSDVSFFDAYVHTHTDIYIYIYTYTYIYIHI